MRFRRTALCIGTVALLVPAVASAAGTSTLPPSQQVSPAILVARIDTNCAVFADAIKTQKPTAVAEVKSSRWVAASDADATALTKTGSSTTFATVWKQAGNYVWVHWVTTDAKGDKRADQLCFRPDGTLARVRQATTIAALDAVGAQAAYFNTDGSVIKRVGAFVSDDPAIYHTVRQLPFFKILP